MGSTAILPTPQEREGGENEGGGWKRRVEEERGWGNEGGKERGGRDDLINGFCKIVLCLVPMALGILPMTKLD